MIPRWLALLILLLPLTRTAAQAPLESTRLTCTPQAAPVPALRHRLLPEVRERTPGNAALLYHRAHSPEWMTGYRRDPKYHENIDAWMKMPLKDLPREHVRAFLPNGLLREVESAARREFCDWEMTPRIREEGMSLVLPDVQAFREFGRLLGLKARLEMSEEKYSQAIHTLESGISLGRHLAECPTLINALVGIAVITDMAARLEELAQLPGAPNLYWSLTALPRPLIDLRTGFQGERLFLDSLLPGVRELLADPKLSPMTAEQSANTVKTMLATLANVTGPEDKKLIGVLNTALLAVRTYPAAKQFLLDQGRTEQQVEAIPVAQAIMMFEVHHFDRMFDEMLKWHGLPFPEAHAGRRRAVEELKQGKANNILGMTLAVMLLPAVEKVHEASVRLDRRIAMLRTIELLRLHAAAHDGKLPAALADIRVAPVPIDPYTDKPFDYQVKDNQATLIAPPRPGEQPTSANSMRYEATMIRK